MAADEAGTVSLEDIRVAEVVGGAWETWVQSGMNVGACISDVQVEIALGLASVDSEWTYTYTGLY